MYIGFNEEFDSIDDSGCARNLSVLAQVVQFVQSDNLVLVMAWCRIEKSNCGSICIQSYNELSLDGHFSKTDTSWLFVHNFLFGVSMHGGGPTLWVGLALVRGLDFTSRLHGENQALLPELARLADSPELTTFIFPRNPESDICVYKVSFYILHINKQNL